MTFNPSPKQKLLVENTTYRVAEHPAAPGMPYGQEGRRAVVYQLIAEDGSKHALKVFKSRFRVPGMVSVAEALAPYTNIPGLQACERVVLTASRHRKLLSAYPDLTYAVLMPWVEGETWQEILLDSKAYSPEKSLQLAKNFAEILVGLEEHRLAHCDLSGPNLIIQPEDKVGLVDLEEMYGPGFLEPKELPAGSPGYAHQSAPRGLWMDESDRFSGAVLLAEMLTWCDPNVRERAWGESYFAPKDMQGENDRYQLLHSSLESLYGNRIAALFAQAWRSDSLRDCPTFAEWAVALPEEVPEIKEEITQPEKEIHQVHSEAALDLVLKAQISSYNGDIQDALAFYNEAISLVSPEIKLKIEKCKSVLDKKQESIKDTHQAQTFDEGTFKELDALDGELKYQDYVSDADISSQEIIEDTPTFVLKDEGGSSEFDIMGKVISWDIVAWLALAGGVSWIIDLTIGGNINWTLGGILGGLIIGLVTGIILQRQKTISGWRAILLVALGWAIGGGIGLTIFGEFGASNRWSWRQYTYQNAIINFDGTTIWVIGWAISTAIGKISSGLLGSLVTWFVLRKYKAISGWKSFIWVTLGIAIGWGIGGAISGAVGRELNQSLSWTTSWAISGAIGGIFGGAIGASILRWQINRSNKGSINVKEFQTAINQNISWKMVAWTTLGWAISGIIGEIVNTSTGWRIGYPWTLGWAISGAIGGFITGIILLRRRFSSGWKPIAWTSLGWALSWAAYWVIYWAIGETTGWEISQAISGAIGGGIGGFITGVLLQKHNALSGWKSLALATLGWVIGWAAGGAVGGTIGLEIGGNIGWIIAWGINGLISGAVGASILKWQINSSTRESAS